ncbi:MAG: RnfH family protein [Paucimonas sp.]|jgi:putative ubiquitin-RnfH superfamily antitoxin RatB of RatAB toxin-antitoxin module|nr:RnfH family protein [Paucimonas sp.]
MAGPETIRVQVCYVKPGVQLLRDLEIAQGTTLEQAIQQSGILTDMPEIDLSVHKVGIFGKVKALDTVLRQRDRVEIYRLLVADPKESRRQRVEKKARKLA